MGDAAEAEHVRTPGLYTGAPVDETRYGSSGSREGDGFLLPNGVPKEDLAPMGGEGRPAYSVIKPIYSCICVCVCLLAAPNGSFSYSAHAFPLRLIHGVKNSMCTFAGYLPCVGCVAVTVPQTSIPRTTCLLPYENRARHRTSPVPMTSAPPHLSLLTHARGSHPAFALNHRTSFDKATAPISRFPLDHHRQQRPSHTS